MKQPKLPGKIIAGLMLFLAFGQAMGQTSDVTIDSTKIKQEQKAKFELSYAKALNFIAGGLKTDSEVDSACIYLNQAHSLKPDNVQIIDWQKKYCSAINARLYMDTTCKMSRKGIDPELDLKSYKDKFGNWITLPWVYPNGLWYEFFESNLTAEHFKLKKDTVIYDLHIIEILPCGKNEYEFHMVKRTCSARTRIMFAEGDLEHYKMKVEGNGKRRKIVSLEFLYFHEQP